VVVVPATDLAEVAPAAFDWLRSVQKDAAVIMSVCNGSFVLAKAGLLDGKRATAHHGGYGMLRAMYPDVTVIRGMRYVEDGKIATSGGLTSGVDLAMRVVERYFGRAVAEKTAKNLEYQGEGWKRPASNAAFAERPAGTAERPLDPVCESQVDKKTALQREHKQKTYYFCSDMCLSHFEQAPERFIDPS
jgi:transcriptional regulator GlxA family with amidase domain